MEIDIKAAYNDLENIKLLLLLCLVLILLFKDMMKK